MYIHRKTRCDYFSVAKVNAFLSKNEIFLHLFLCQNTVCGHTSISEQLQYFMVLLPFTLSLHLHNGGFTGLCIITGLSAVAQLTGMLTFQFNNLTFSLTATKPVQPPISEACITRHRHKTKHLMSLSDNIDSNSRQITYVCVHSIDN